MKTPVILAVDDDPPVLAAVRRDLRSHYRSDYRIVTAAGGPEALEAVEQLHQRGDDVALLLVDQRMPELTGTELLIEVRPYFPDARKVLLTAYADTAAAIQSINEVGLDHYLMKPWEPPEDHLFPILDELLDDWMANRPAPFDGVRVVGPRWDAASHDTKEFLARNHVPYRFIDVERDVDEAALLIGAAAAGGYPVLLLPDGTKLVHPTNLQVAEAIGLRSHASAPFRDLLILGAGPAGLAAAVYGASEGLDVTVLERQAAGGQAGASSRIENYLGFPNGISGSDLARRAAAQATRLGAEIVSPVDVVGLRVEGPARVVELADGRELSSHCVLVATGMRVRQLDVEGAHDLHGAGVYYGATLPEATTYAGEHVIIVGGANSAGQAAIMFARFAEQVTIVVRARSLADKMSRYLVDQIDATANIAVSTETVVRAVKGAGHLEQVELDIAGGTRTASASGLFVFVGAIPHTEFLRDVVALTDHGFVPTGSDITGSGMRPPDWPLDRDPYPMETSVPGIFAAGDVRDGAIRRVAAAVGQGSSVISLVHRYLEDV